MRRIWPIFLLLGGCELGPIYDIGTTIVDAGPTRDAGSGPERRDAGTGGRDAGGGGPGPDLVVTLGDAPATLVPGEVFELDIVVENRGERGANTTIVRLDLVAEDAPTSVEIGIINEVTLAALDRLERRRVLVVPTTLAAGLYRVVATADPDDLVAETNERNNTTESEPIVISFLAITPSRFDLGTVGVGCSASLDGTLDNRGGTRVFVSELALDETTDPSFTLSAPALPLPVPAGESRTFTIDFAPTMAGTFGGDLIVQSASLRATVPLVGRAEVDPAREDRFTQRTAPKLDALFVVDDSSSMADDAEALARGASVFFRSLENRGFDLQAGVTTTDVSMAGARGKLLGDPPVLTPGPMAARRFEVRVRAGSSGAEPASGLEAARLALSEPALSGDNAGFLRADAALAVVFIADEDDGSPDTLDAYRTFLTSLKPDGAFASFAIVGSDGGMRYATIAQATAGSVSPIVDFDWLTSLADFPGGNVGYRQRFELSRRPLDDSVSVEVDGLPLDSGWRYEEVPPSVVFDAIAVPEPGVEVVVRYRSGC